MAIMASAARTATTMIISIQVKPRWRVSMAQ